MIQKMKDKKLEVDSPKEKARFEINQRTLETLSLDFLYISCDFQDLFENIAKKVDKVSKKNKINKAHRRKSIKNCIAHSQNMMEKRKQSHKKYLKQNSLFTVEDFEKNDVSFMIDYNTKTASMNSISPIFIGSGLESEGLDTTIAFISSEDDEDQKEMDEFAEQINGEFLKKDFHEIWKDFNDITLLLFSKNLKEVVLSYRSSPQRFKEVHFKTEHLDNTDNSNISTNYSTQIISDSLHLESPHLRRGDTVVKHGDETNFNREMAKIYREQYNDSSKDSWIEIMFWAFLGSTIVIIAIFILLFYCNVFSK